jgi:hypothetical protein
MDTVRATAQQILIHTSQVKVGLLVHTNSPEMSEYFLAGLKDGGASMVQSEKYEYSYSN